jgi:hypothetical protein
LTVQFKEVFVAELVQTCASRGSMVLSQTLFSGNLQGNILDPHLIGPCYIRMRKNGRHSSCWKQYSWKYFVKFGWTFSNRIEVGGSPIRRAEGPIRVNS